ncbi:MAG: glycosyltransferase family 1 protein [Nitrospirae bacterium]|nr:MAG: glycosyltransferase family 1 protein [Nitrospirota bacterium]
MKIAVDAFPLLSKHKSGIPNYVRNILSHILDEDTADEYFLYSKNPVMFQDRPNLRCRVKHSATAESSSYGNTLWLFSKGVQMMKQDCIDIFWGTRQMLPPFLPGGIKKVLTVYDLVWHYFPGTMDAYNRLVMNFFTKSSIRSADHIITISDASRKALVDVMRISEERISVIYPAADGYMPLDKNDSALYISEKYQTNKDYVLTVSTIEPRKNLPMLLKIFSKFKHSGIQLLIAGASGWKNSAIFAEYRRLGFSEDQVRFLGYVPDEDMNRLYSGARLFLFPSIYEGFGIPPLEAMAAGTPVITSNSSSLPEVTGDYGMLLDPHDLSGWQDAIDKVLYSRTLQDDLVHKGLQSAKRFSWEHSASQTLEIFKKLV